MLGVLIFFFQIKYMLKKLQVITTSHVTISNRASLNIKMRWKSFYEQ